MSITLPQAYTSLQAWLHDHLIGNRALKLHAHIIDSSGLRAVLAEQTPRKLLDVGCGGGQSPLHLKEIYPHLEITGIDLSEDQILRARKRARAKGLSVRFETADAQALPFQDEEFDVVFSFGSAKHWPDPRKGIAECWRVLKPGGELCIADATSDATREEIDSFFYISQFPRILRAPATAAMRTWMFANAQPASYYKGIADNVGLPPGSVGRVPDMPAFLIRARKPE